MNYKVSHDDYIHGGTQLDYYSEKDVETTACLNCGSEKRIHIYTERGHLGIVRCQDCDLIYTSPCAKDTEKNYFGDAQLFYNEAHLIFKGKQIHHRDKNYEYELREIQRIKPKGTLLDIGSNMGFFLRKAREFGFQAEGVEPSESLAGIARQEFKLTINNNFFKKEDYAGRHFDVMTLIDVFEHVSKPKDLLKEIHAVLDQDGILCIKVPNGNYNVLKLKIARLMNREAQHELFNAYEHVGHYTIASMKKMAESCGFKVQKAIVPLPVDPPLWANLVGHYFQYPSPFWWDWKRIVLRKLFYWVGKLENAFSGSVHFGPDLLFVLRKG